jgi:endo-1,4-beta-xylanase
MLKKIKQFVILVLVLIFGFGVGTFYFKKPELTIANASDLGLEMKNNTSLYKTSKRLQIGTAIRSQDLDNAKYKSVLNSNFNLIVPEFEMKWSSIQTSKDVYNFSKIDKLVEYATKNNIKIHGHTLLWYRSIPDWVEPYLENLAESKRSEALIDILRDYVFTMVGRYKGIIGSWDVANEVLADFSKTASPPGIYRTDNIFDKYLGNDSKNGVPEYIELAFKFAREADPKAKLFYNDYHIEYIGSKETSWSGNWKAENALEMVKKLKSGGVPIDGIGIQSHITNIKKLDAVAYDTNSIQSYHLYKTINAYKELGLEVKITEMDVIVYADKGSKPSQEDLQKQANTYQNYLLACIKLDNCTGFTVWQFSDNYVWYDQKYPGKKEDYHPNLFDRNWQPKPAYFALLDLLQKNN